MPKAAMHPVTCAGSYSRSHPFNANNQWDAICVMSDAKQDQESARAVHSRARGKRRTVIETLKGRAFKVFRAYPMRAGTRGISDCYAQPRKREAGG